MLIFALRVVLEVIQSENHVASYSCTDCSQQLAEILAKILMVTSSAGVDFIRELALSDDGRNAAMALQGEVATP